MPPDLLRGLEEMTMEGWVKWEEIARTLDLPERFGTYGYGLAINTSASEVDFQAIGPGHLRGWQRLEIGPSNASRQLDWTLYPAAQVAGKVTGLDGKTPLANVVVELVRPEDGSSRRLPRRSDAETGEEALTSTPQSELRTPNSNPSLVTSAATTNRVLQLDWPPASSVRLPPTP